MQISPRWKLVIIALLVVVAFCLRVDDLAAAGLSEDEVNKVDAARAYLQGDFSQNREHPMLMKLEIAACLALSDAWNARFARYGTIPEEIPVRFPNVLFGSLMTAVMFLFADLMFGPAVGLTAAAFWATGVSAIAINRIAKEDTFLVFFYWLCLYFFERAKRFGASTAVAKTRLYGIAGACLGMMLASKYFPHYWGLIFLFYHFLGQNETNQPLTRRDFIWFYGGFAMFFVAFNPTVLLPSTLKYFMAYTEEETVTHHGYVLMGRIYANNFSASPGGLPMYFYPLLLAIKTPLTVLGAFVGGLIVAVRRRRHVGYLFLVFMLVLWIVPYSLFAAKWLRYILSLLPVVYICAAIGVVELYRYVVRWVNGAAVASVRAAVMTLLAIAFIGLPLVSSAKSAPAYSMYLNPLGMGREGYFFPHDEFYDAGLREAIEYVCQHAPPNAVIAGEAPPVFRYYQHRFGRDDLQFVATSTPPTGRVAAPYFTIVQPGRVYFENEGLVARLQATTSPVTSVRVDGAVAAQVFATAAVGFEEGAR